MREAEQTDLSLDDTVDQQAQHCQHGSGRDPFGLLPPHGGNRRRVLDPAKARFHGRLLLLIGLENLGIRTDLSAHRRGEHRPPISFFGLVQGLDLHGAARARLCRGRGGLRRTSPARPTRAAGVGHDAIAYGMIPPGLGPAAAPPRAPVLGLRDRRFGIRLTGKPPRLRMRDVRNDRFGFLCLCRAICLGLLLRQLARMHDHKAQGLVSSAPVTVLDLHLAGHALPVPAAWGFILRPTRFLHEEGQGGLLVPPRFAVLTDGTGARDSRHQAHPVLPTQAPGAATIRLTVGYKPTYPVSAQRETLRNSQGRFHAIAAVPITPAAAQR
jgi:hypothetical protein